MGELIIGLIISAVGAGIGAAANKKESEAAREESGGMFNDQMAVEAGDRSFNRSMANKQLSLTKKQMAIGEDQFNRSLGETQRVNTANITDQQVKRIEGFLNNNTALQQLVLSRWGGK